MEGEYASVIIDNKASELNRVFTYKIGDDLRGNLEVGMRVVVPFGRGNKYTKGIVIEINKDFSGDYELKEIEDLLDDKPLVSRELLELSRWMRNEYLSTYVNALNLVLPPGDYKEIETYVELVYEDYKWQNREEEKIINLLKENNPILLGQLKRNLKITNINKYLNNLEEMGIIETTIDIKTSQGVKKEKWIKLIDEDIEIIKEKVGSRAKKQLEIVEYIYDREMPIKDVLMELDTSLSVVRELENKRVAHIFEKVVTRQALKRNIDIYEKHELNTMQKAVFEEIMRSIIGLTDDKAFLIHGVTGSGKTEVYLQLVEEMLKMEKDSIILVPEISLTPQTIDRFVGRFGDKVAILHSRLSQGERFDEWKRIKEGKVKIAIGARSAVFAPFKNLGLIVIDEEHENTYKSSQNPKYDTIEVAKKRLELEGGILVLGTATPSLVTYYKAKSGGIKLLEMKDRVKNIELPDISLVDMREELNEGNFSIFSRELHGEMVNSLEKGEQIILFLNRRGFASFVSCRQCGYVVKCDNCDISMTFHKGVNRLRCHYCGETKQIPRICPDCGSKYIKSFGIGTEQVEEKTKEIFPNANIRRMDGDTTNTKGSYEKILEDMKNDKIDILIGTQMISKGLDFKNVNLVGIITADTTLNLPDYTSPEKTFQLITQVAGRAGRGDKKGKVILQTYEPEHYSIVHAKNHDYLSFIEDELSIREEFLYPPYVKLINIMISGENRLEVRKLSEKLYKILGSEIYHLYGDDFRKYIIGPNPALIERINREFRYQIIVKVKPKDAKRLKDLLYRVYITNSYNIDLKDKWINIEIDPITII